MLGRNAGEEECWGGGILRRRGMLGRNAGEEECWEMTARQSSMAKQLPHWQRILCTCPYEHLIFYRENAGEEECWGGMLGRGNAEKWQHVKVVTAPLNTEHNIVIFQWPSNLPKLEALIFRAVGINQEMTESGPLRTFSSSCTMSLRMELFSRLKYMDISYN